MARDTRKGPATGFRNPASPSNMVGGEISRPAVTLEAGENNPGEPTTVPEHPTLDDQFWAAFVRDKFQRARAYRRPRVTQWLKNYKILTTRTWSSARPSWMPDPEINELSDIVDSWVGWVTDQRPIITTKGFAQTSSPYSSFMSKLGDDLSNVMASVAASESYDLAIEQVVTDAVVYGIGWLKTTWNPLSVGGMGDAIIRRVDPFALYSDPNATSMEDCGYFIEARTLSMEEVERRFGRKIAETLQESGYQEQVEAAPDIIKGAIDQAKAIPGTITPGYVPSYGQPGQNAGRLSATDVPGVTVLEAWVREYREVDIRGINTRYETWRCIVVTGDRVLFNEMATDMWHHGDHPYTRYVLKERGEFYGQSLVELLTPIQLSINRLLAAIEQNIWLTGNPVFKEDQRAGLSRTKITNQPGQRLPLTGGANATAEWLVPPQLHPQLTQGFIEFYIKQMQQIAGLTAQNRGQLPAGRNSTETLDDVQEGSFIKIRLALRNLERALRRSYTLSASLVIEFYDSPRMMAILGPDGQESSLALKAKHFYLPTPDGFSLPMRFTLSVNAGSSLPTSRIARAQEADVLFAMGAIDGQAVLEAHQWPGAAAITERVKKATAEGTFQPPGARQRTQRTS